MDAATIKKFAKKMYACKKTSWLHVIRIQNAKAINAVQPDNAKLSWQANVKGIMSVKLAAANSTVYWSLLPTAQQTFLTIAHIFHMEAHAFFIQIVNPSRALLPPRNAWDLLMKCALHIINAFRVAAGHQINA